MDVLWDRPLLVTTPGSATTCFDPKAETRLDSDSFSSFEGMVFSTVPPPSFYRPDEGGSYSFLTLLSFKVPPVIIARLLTEHGRAERFDLPMALTN